MPEAEYRALPALSGTGVKTLLDSPADYLWRQSHKFEVTPAMAFGTLVHALMLGTYEEADDPFSYEPPTLNPAIVVAPFDNFRSKEAREWKALQELDGKEVVSQSAHATMLEKLEADTEKLEARKREAHDRAGEIVTAINSHSVASELLGAPGFSEVSFIDEWDGAAIKGRIDRLPDDGPVIDLKTARLIDPRKMAYAIDDFGYALQLAHYAKLAHRPERPYVIAAQTEGRPAVAVYRLGEETWDLALAAAGRAWDVYAECVRTDTWPDPYAGRVIDLDLPGRALARMDEQVSGMAAADVVAALENLIGENNE